MFNEPTKTGGYCHKCLNVNADCTCDEKELSSTGFIESDKILKEKEDYPAKEYQRLFNAISDTHGIPLVSQMQEIIDIVHKDFPLIPSPSEIELVCKCDKPLGFTLVAGYLYCNKCGKRY